MSKNLNDQEIMQIISQVMKNREEQPSDFRISLLLLLGHSIYYLIQEWIRKKYQAKVDHVLIQQCLDKSSLVELVEQWRRMESSYSSYDLMQGQFNELSGTQGVLRDIFFDGIPRKPMVLGRSDIVIDSNDLLSDRFQKILTTKLHRLTISQPSYIELGNETYLDFKNSNRGEGVKHNILSNKWLRNNRRELYNHLDRKDIMRVDMSYVLNLFLQKMVFRCFDQNVIQGVPVVIDNQALQLSDYICVFGTALISRNRLKITNIKYIGKSFSELKNSVLFHWKRKIERVQLKQAICLVSMGIVIGLMVGMNIQSMYGRLNLRMYNKEFPRVIEVKQRFEEARIDKKSKGLLCNVCKHNLINYVFIPCYHMQCCEECFNKENRQQMCQICKKEVYCGIKLYTS